MKQDLQLQEKNTPRIEFLHVYIGAVLKAVRNGSDTRGYLVLDCTLLISAILNSSQEIIQTLCSLVLCFPQGQYHLSWFPRHHEIAEQLIFLILLVFLLHLYG
ncbi:hypothetical protein Rs2_32296 [Raphanus sativus]|nr:hypothetical protein Rs2_32296 [Raphanus sativus]